MLTRSQLVLGCTLVVSLILASSALGLEERLFSIKGRELRTKHDVATQLRHFLPKQIPHKERCERYALALAEFEKKDSLNYFKMADLAVMDKRRAKAEFQRIVWLQLMNLYKSGVESFRNAHKVNAAMVDLHGCLKADFGSREARAIGYLNDKDLQKIIKQWNMISREKAELLSGQGQNSVLSLKDLHGDVRKSVAHWQQASLPNEKIATLARTYDSLSPDTSLADTCRVYNEVISGTRQPEKTPAEGQPEDVFVPSQTDRANFLFMLRMVQLSQGAEGLFLDLAFCAQKWKDVDDEVKEYFNSAEYLEALDNIRPPEGAMESETVDQPVKA